MGPRAITARIGVISCGYVVASIAAGFAMGAAMAGITFAGSGFSGLVSVIFVSMLSPALTIPFIFMLAFLPAAAFILYAERRGVRSPIAYAIMGALAGVAVSTAVLAASIYLTGSTTAIWGWQGLASQAAAIAGVYAFPGLCGGLAYWAIAGRTAGSGRAEPSSGAA